LFGKTQEGRSADGTTAAHTFDGSSNFEDASFTDAGGVVSFTPGQPDSRFVGFTVGGAVRATCWQLSGEPVDPAQTDLAILRVR
jgi:hypothetical protein